MKNGILKGKGLDLGAEPPCINLLGTPRPPSLRFVVTRSIMRGALGFSVLRFWLFFRSVFRFLLQKTSVFRFWWSSRFVDFSFFSIWFSVFVKNTSSFSVLVPDVVFGFWKGSEVQ